MTVQQLLSHRWRWSQGQFARNILGVRVDGDSRWAYRFCLIGAVRRCYPETRERMPVMDRLFLATHLDPAQWNDREGRTFAEVQELVRRLDL